MNKYYIERRIYTFADLAEPREVADFKFSKTDIISPRKLNSWVVSKIVVATDYLVAMNDFEGKLRIVVNALSIHSQSTFELAPTTMLVVKILPKTDVFYIYFSKDVKTVGLSIMNDDLDDIENLVTDAGLWQLFLRLANSASDSVSRLSLLIIALESLAGNEKISRNCVFCNERLECSRCKKPVPDGCRTDHGILKSILGDELYENLYGKGRVRPKLVHKGIDSPEANKYVIPTYERIRKYIVEKYKLNTLVQIKNAPRSFMVTYGGMFLKSKMKEDISLSSIEKHVWNLVDNHKTETEELLSVDPVKNY